VELGAEKRLSWEQELGGRDKSWKEELEQGAMGLS